nr:MAG TPA: hypothetical protein [Caudoviricetes sp.]
MRTNVLISILLYYILIKMSSIFKKKGSIYFRGG